MYARIVAKHVFECLPSTGVIHYHLKRLRWGHLFVYIYIYRLNICQHLMKRALGTLIYRLYICQHLMKKKRRVHSSLYQFLATGCEADHEGHGRSESRESKRKRVLGCPVHGCNKKTCMNKKIQQGYMPYCTHYKHLVKFKCIPQRNDEKLIGLDPLEL